MTRIDVDSGNADQTFPFSDSEVLVCFQHPGVEPVSWVTSSVKMGNLVYVAWPESTCVLAITGFYYRAVDERHLQVLSVGLQAMGPAKDGFHPWAKVRIEALRQHGENRFQESVHHPRLFGKREQRGQGLAEVEESYRSDLSVACCRIPYGMRPEEVIQITDAVEMEIDVLPQNSLDTRLVVQTKKSHDVLVRVPGANEPVEKITFLKALLLLDQK